MADTKTCGRCKGQGFIAAFAHVGGGKCLRCQGRGTVGKAWDAAAQEAYFAACDAEGPSETATAQAEARARKAARAARRAAATA